MDFEAQMQDEQFVSHVLGVWEREMEEFRLGQLDAATGAQLESVRDMVRLSDAQRYVNLSRRLRHRSR